MSAPEQRWVLVPREPVAEMLRLGGHMCDEPNQAEDQARASGVWTMMISAAPKPSDEDLERAFRAGQRALNDIRYRRGAQMISGTFKEGDPADAMLEDAKVCLRAALDALGA